jgi:hypothetical protein
MRGTPHRQWVPWALCAALFVALAIALLARPSAPPALPPVLPAPPAPAALPLQQWQPSPQDLQDAQRMQAGERWWAEQARQPVEEQWQEYRLRSDALDAEGQGILQHMRDTAPLPIPQEEQTHER